MCKNSFEVKGDRIDCDKDRKPICKPCSNALWSLDGKDSTINNDSLLKPIELEFQETVMFVGTVSRLGKQRVICVPKTIQDTFNLDWKYKITLRKKEEAK